jgi:hypothetical protein
MKKVKKTKVRGQLSGHKAATDIEKARFCTNFLLLENCAKYGLDPEPEPAPKPFQSRKFGTGIIVPQHWFLETQRHPPEFSQPSR